MMKSLKFAALATAILAMAPACVHYHLGSMLPPDIRTVYVPTVQNQTDEPFLEQDTTSAIISQIQMDGSLKVVPESQADAVLDVVLTRFWINAISYVYGSTAKEYRMNLKASIVLRRRSDNSVILESPAIEGWSDFEFTGDLTSSKAVALRPTAEDLGRRIINKVVMYWPEHAE